MSALIKNTRIDLTISAYTENQLRRSHAQRLCADIIGSDSETDIDEDVVIGSIVGWKVVWLEAEDLIFWAGAVSDDCVLAFEWLTEFSNSLKDPILGETIFNLLWIDRVEIKPEYRGHFVDTLKCVATFLDLANPDIVFARCGFEGREVQNDRLAKLWKKLGFKQNGSYLYLRDWGSPQWLQGDLDLRDI